MKLDGKPDNVGSQIRSSQSTVFQHYTKVLTEMQLSNWRDASQQMLSCNSPIIEMQLKNRPPNLLVHNTIHTAVQIASKPPLPR